MLDITKIKWEKLKGEAVLIGEVDILVGSETYSFRAMAIEMKMEDGSAMSAKNDPHSRYDALVELEPEGSWETVKIRPFKGEYIVVIHSAVR